MTDIVDATTRSRMMSAIKGANTTPELIVRKHLFKKGFRYRLHDKKKPGKPDIVLPLYRAVIFVNGCFWHGHNCHLFKIPSTNREFWTNKIRTNRENDQKNNKLLSESGWRILIIWECALKGGKRLPIDSLIDSVSAWLRSSKKYAEY
jgi:DNA mismatch endonuclease, patch repair protein